MATLNGGLQPGHGDLLVLRGEAGEGRLVARAAQERLELVGGGSELDGDGRLEQVVSP